MTTRTTSVQGESDRGAMPWQLADRNSSWSGGGFFQHSAGRPRQHNEKTLPDSSRSGVLLAGHSVQRLATRTRRHKDKRRKRKPLRRCELTCESLPCKLKSFFKSTTYRSRWRSGRDTPGFNQNLLIFIRKFFGDVTSFPEKTVPLVVTPVIIAGSLVHAYCFVSMLIALAVEKETEAGKALAQAGVTPQNLNARTERPNPNCRRTARNGCVSQTPLHRLLAA